jgi:hypothetical protein
MLLMRPRQRAFVELLDGSESLSSSVHCSPLSSTPEKWLWHSFRDLSMWG